MVTGDSMVTANSTDSRPPFDQLAVLYDRFIGAMDREGNPARDWLLTHLVGGGRALDVGCGNGRNCRLVADRYREVVGVDISADMLRVARSKDNPPNVRYERRDVRELSPERDGVFDAVFAMNSLFAMGPAEAVLPLLRPLVAPGGRLVVLDVTRPDDAPVPDDETRQTFHPFEVAHTVYRLSGDTEDAVAALRYMLHPAWREMSAGLVPPTLGAFRRAYEGVVPGVEFAPEVVPTLTGAVWRAPV
ncbi:class I SAM-dependent methyltransferase [Streptomyces sp. NBC_01803]|uniref:class I SAM-dependent methyltransferase n=1 Tax=Streptomyces sp. NBC_01803 TaxID=2975946 RepID=UPI002DD863EE|nr:class I SAM-dependent methyltransferase [Streptomyces sp. NBC_01803]WSA42868.1 methyltransferase domain-containing protein [Streptomyces sp. NBC_01803]